MYETSNSIFEEVLIGLDTFAKKKGLSIVICAQSEMLKDEYTVNSDFPSVS